MKKLLLLFALFILGCSSDDENVNNDSSNDNSSLTFTEKYDGIVWKRTNDNFSSDDEARAIIHNNPKGYTYIEMNNNTENCSTTIFDVSEGSELVTITENSGNTLEANVVDEDGTYTLTFSVSSDETTLTTVSSDYPNDPEIFEKTTLSSSCN